MTNNYLRIVDRKKEIIVSGGENISSLEVEKVLLSHPAVYEAVVIPVPDEKWGEVPKALVVLKLGAQTSGGGTASNSAAPTWHITNVHTRSSSWRACPKTGSGKLLKRELRQKYWTSEKIRL